MRKAFIAFVLALVALNAPAEAATYFQTVSDTGDKNVASGSLLPFDDSLGILDSVSVIYDVTASGFALWQGAATDSSFFMGAGTTLSNNGKNLNYSVFRQPVFHLKSGEISIITLTESFAYSYETPADLAFFTNGDIAYNILTSASVSVPPQGFFYFDAIGSSGVSRVTLAYNYTIASVPEPAAWIMMLIGVGTAGSAFRARRRRSTSASSAIPRLLSPNQAAYAIFRSSAGSVLSPEG